VIAIFLPSPFVSFLYSELWGCGSWGVLLLQFFGNCYHRLSYFFARVMWIVVGVLASALPHHGTE